jgi:hypothetical protein
MRKLFREMIYIWKEPLKAPIEPAKLLTLENLLDINNELREDALRDSHIEYSGSSDYSIKINESRKADRIHFES